MQSEEPSDHNMRFTGAKSMIEPNTPGLVIACFQNVPIPHRPLNAYRSARTAITLSLESGKAIGEISPASWIGEDTPTVDFEVGVTHCAAVAVFTQDGWCGCRVASTKTSWGDVGYSIERPALPAGIIKASVTLIGEMNISLQVVHLTLDLKPDGTATVRID